MHNKHTVFCMEGTVAPRSVNPNFPGAAVLQLKANMHAYFNNFKKFIYCNTYFNNWKKPFIVILVYIPITLFFDELNNLYSVQEYILPHSIHFYRWDSLCYLTEVKKKKDYNQSTCVLYIYLKKMQNMNNFFPSKYWY